jgi:FkbM family methyltransferase
VPIEEAWLADAVVSAVSSLQSRSLAVDVGANTGTWTKELSRVFSRVVAIEPDGRASSSIAREDNVTIIEAVASSESGKSTLYLRPSPDQNSMLQEHPIGAGGMSGAPSTGAVEVEAVSLDDLCPEGADFVKIDVEGAEQQVLAGCSADGRWSRTVFVVECHDTKDAVISELSRLGRVADFIGHPCPGAHPGHCWAVTRQ